MPRGFAVLALSYEKDQFTGFTSRFTQAVGLGYRRVDAPWLTVAFDGGPALRQAMFTDGTSQSELALRAALNGKWVITPAISFTETAPYYSDQRNSSLLSLSQLTARLNGRLSARFSFQYNNESNPPPGRLNSDTVTRATLVYSF